MTFPVVYESAAKVAKGPQPGAKALMAWCLTNYSPGTNLGIYNPRSVRGGTALSLHAEGRAIDVGFPVELPAGHPTGWRLANDMRTNHADLGVQCIIFARQIWTNLRPQWRPYSGVAAHFDHVHIELTRAAGAGLTTALIQQTMEEPTMPTDRTALVKELQQVLKEAGFYAGGLDGDPGPATLAAVHSMKNDRARWVGVVESVRAAVR